MAWRSFRIAPYASTLSIRLPENAFRTRGSSSAVTARHSMPAAACSQNTAVHIPQDATYPPTIGATTGVRNVNIATHETARDASAPLQRSRMIARDNTIAAAAPSPCRKRLVTSAPRLSEHAESTHATTYTPRPTHRIGFRPYRSESGP